MHQGIRAKEFLLIRQQDAGVLELAAQKWRKMFGIVKIQCVKVWQNHAKSQFPSECPNLFLTAVNKRPGFMKFIWFLLTPGYDWIHYHLDPSGASDPVAPETCLEGEPC